MNQILPSAPCTCSSKSAGDAASATENAVHLSSIKQCRRSAPSDAFWHSSLELLSVCLLLTRGAGTTSENLPSAKRINPVSPVLIVAFWLPSPKILDEKPDFTPSASP